MINKLSSGEKANLSSFIINNSAQHKRQWDALMLAFIRTRQAFPFWVPLIGLSVFSLVFWLTDWDLLASSLFYSPSENQFVGVSREPWHWLDRWGVYPGVIIGVIALVGVVHAIRVKIWNSQVQCCVILASVFALGPGLLVNGTIKPGFSRTRPREITQFGGEKAYMKIFEIADVRYNNSSFPSGHASIGFFMLTLGFLFPQRRSYRWLCFGLGISWGALMSLSRIIQGAHFLSDTIWSMAIIYFCGWATVCVLESKRLTTLVNQEEAQTEQRLDTVQQAA